MIYILISLIVLGYLYLFYKPIQSIENVGFKNKYRGFLPTFLILAFFSAIRDNCGCDYESYMIHIENIQLGRFNYMEPGFQEAVRQLAKIDDNPRFVIIIFGVLTCFFYLFAIWNQSTNRSFSVFIFLTWGYYFLTYNTIRNYFVLSLILCAIPLLLKQKHIIFVSILLFAATFHKSALFCIPIYYIAVNIQFKKNHVFPLIILTIVLLLSESYLRSFVFSVYGGYENSEYDTGSISYLNILKAFLVIWIYIKFNIKDLNDSLCNFYFNLNVFALVLYVGTYWLPEISRIGFYLNATVIFFIPRMLDNLINFSQKQGLKTIIYCGSFILFLLLLNSFTSKTIRLLPYKTWLFDGIY